EPLEMSAAAIRGTWQAVAKNGSIALRLGDSNDPAWTLDAKGAVRDNPDGAARWTWTGTAGGLNSTAVPWGLDSPPRRGWLSTPGEPRIKDLAEFRLVRDDLLRVKGRIPLPGMEIEV